MILYGVFTLKDRGKSEFAIKNKAGSDGKSLSFVSQDTPET